MHECMIGVQRPSDYRITAFPNAQPHMSCWITNCTSLEVLVVNQSPSIVSKHMYDKLPLHTCSTLSSGLCAEEVRTLTHRANAWTSLITTATNGCWGKCRSDDRTRTVFRFTISVHASLLEEVTVLKAKVHAYRYSKLSTALTCPVWHTENTGYQPVRVQNRSKGQIYIYITKEHCSLFFHTLIASLSTAGTGTDLPKRVKCMGSANLECGTAACNTTPTDAFNKETEVKQKQSEWQG